MSDDRPLIVADIGNSAIKIACYRQRSVDEFSRRVDLFRLIPHDAATWQRLLEMLPSTPADWRIASVRRDSEEQLAAWIQKQRAADEYHLLSHADFPIDIRVDAPDRVGSDRLATATAAGALLSTGHATIVIDAGTAITVDVIDAIGAFQGGVILPGRQAFSQLLATTTDLLSEVTPNLNVPQIPGKSTDDAIQAGAYWGTIGAVQQIVEQISEARDNNVDVLVTGGDGFRIQQHLIRESQFAPHLAVMGIALTTLKQS